MRNIEREIVGGFIFSNDEHILLGKSKVGGVYPGYMLVPGGGVDVDETREVALRREILEETGIDIIKARVTMVNNTQSGTSEKTLRDTGERVMIQMRFTDFSITFNKPAANIPIIAGDDFTEAAWIPIGSLSNLQLTDSTKITLKKLGCL